MKAIMLLLHIFIFTTCCFAQSGILGNQNQAAQRVDFIKKSTVKILIDRVKSGTGFFVSEKGILLTNFHVLMNENTKYNNTKNGIEILSRIQIVDYKNDTLDVEIINNLKQQNKINESIAWDYGLLRLKQKQNIEYFLKIGNSKSIPEGTTIYTCGFPFNLNEPFVSTGIVSTKFEDELTINNEKYKVNKIWLDLTINKGNSGGALVVLGETPEDDKVIGITSFIITPYYKELQGLNNYIDEMSKRGSVQIMGINFLEYAKMINSTLNANSVGISGAISIDYIKEKIK